MLHVFRPVSFSRTHQATCIAAPMAYVVEQTPSTSIPHGPKRFVSVVCFQIAPICISLHRQTPHAGSTYVNGTQNLCTAPTASSSTSTNQIISTSIAKAAPTTSTISPQTDTRANITIPASNVNATTTISNKEITTISSVSTTQTPHKGIPIGAILGGIIGGLILFFVLLYCCWRYSSKISPPSSARPPSTSESSWLVGSRTDSRSATVFQVCHLGHRPASLNNPRQQKFFVSNDDTSPTSPTGSEGPPLLPSSSAAPAATTPSNVDLTARAEIAKLRTELTMVMRLLHKNPQATDDRAKSADVPLPYLPPPDSP